jgi:hypothetical protein
MRQYLMHAPWWVLVVVTGVPFGAVMVIFSRLMRVGSQLTVSSPTVDLVCGAIGGLIFGAIMGPITAGRNRRARSVVGPLSAEELAVVLRAAARGPVPADPKLRRAAGRLTRFRLDELTRNWGFTLATSVLFFPLMVYDAVITSAWYRLGALALGCAAVGQVWQSRRRLRRRVARLQAEGGLQPSSIAADPSPNQH